MPEKNFNPLEENDIPQHERDRVFEKYQTLTNLYGAEKAKAQLTSEESLVLINTLANKAIEHYDEKLAQTAIWKIGKATGGKPPSSNAHMASLVEKLLNRDEKAAFMGFLARKMREPRKKS